MTTNTNTLTGQILAVVKRNASRGVTVPQIVRRLEQFGAVDRQTVSSRVSAMYSNYTLEKSGTRTNPETGRPTTVYTTGNLTF